MNPRSLLLVFAAIALVIAAVGIFSLRSRIFADGDREEAKKNGATHLSHESVAGRDLLPTKTTRGEKKILDDGGFVKGSPEWMNTEAGRDYISRLPKALSKMAPHEVEEIEVETLGRIVDNLVFIRYAPSVPKVAYKHKERLPEGWKDAIEVLIETIAFGFGERGNDPRYAYSDLNYFLFSNQFNQDFSMGYAMRKTDGAIFSWELKKTVDADQ